jgi:hypothetical protein
MAESLQPTIWGLGISFSIVAIVAVILRFVARRINGQKLGSDDWTIVTSLVRHAQSHPMFMAIDRLLANTRTYTFQILGLGVTIDILISELQCELGTSNPGFDPPAHYDSDQTICDFISDPTRRSRNPYRV